MKKPTIADVATSIAVIEEKVKVLPDIEKHLKDLNGSIADTNIKLAETDGIAKTARDKAVYNTKRFDRTMLALIVSSIAVITGVVVVLFQILGGVS